MSGRAPRPSAGSISDGPGGADALGLADARRIRQLVKVAQLYHERGLRQAQIAEQLSISQSRVSRLLKEAVEVGVVRTAVVTPRGVHADLEQQLEERYGLREAVVAEVAEEEESQVIAALGAATAIYLETTLGRRHERIGISSWSSTLLATVEVMRPFSQPVAEQVVQVLGGIGDVSAQSHATRLTERMAKLTGARATFLAAPGLVTSAALRDGLFADESLRSVLTSYDRLTLVLTGIGCLSPSPLLRVSGNAIKQPDESRLRKLGAVGDICLHFFDARGELVRSELDERIIGISADAIRRIGRRVGVAGGARKYEAIRAALLGRWVDVLITDSTTAGRLAAEPLAAAATG